MLVGEAAEVHEKIAQVSEHLRLPDIEGNFDLGSLPDGPTCATLRRFMEQVAPKL